MRIKPVANPCIYSPTPTQHHTTKDANILWQALTQRLDSHRVAEGSKKLIIIIEELS